MEVSAHLRGTRLSAQKGRLVADQIRGLPVEQCTQRSCLSVPKKAPQIIKKVLESAIANAEHNEGADIDELKVRPFTSTRGRASKVLPPGPKAGVIELRSRPATSRVTVGDEGTWDRKYIRLAFV